MQQASYCGITLANVLCYICSCAVLLVPRSLRYYEGLANYCYGVILVPVEAIASYLPTGEAG